MVRTLATQMFLGLPLVAVGGMVTFLLMLLTASVAVANIRFQVHLVPFKWHPRLAFVTILFAAVHAVAAL